MTDLDDNTTPQLDQFGYPQYYCLRCGAITAVGTKFVPTPPQTVLEETARQLLASQPNMSAMEMAARLRITPLEANKLTRKIRGDK